MLIKPTLKTISELSGLAITTVSRALSNAPDISISTKEKVKKIADEIGYIPDRAGVRLRTGRTNVISLIMSTDSEIMDMTGRLISSIALGLRGTPYHLNMTHHFPGDDPMKPIKYIVETGSADALIFNQVQPNDPRVHYLIEKRFPFTMHGRSCPNEKQSFVDYDNGEFAKIAIEKLVKKNRKHILMITPPQNQSYGLEMVQSAKNTAEKHNISLIIAPIITSDSSITLISDTVSKQIINNKKIDGILVGTPKGAMAAVAGFEKLNLTIGQDIDIVAKDAVNFLKLFRNQIIVINENVEIAGKKLAEAAIHAAQNPDSEPIQYIDRPESDYTKFN
ncbi:MAG: LacI family transcriptional regulator [Amylibacter sp.]|jgi:LacI family transcriptional regulator|nr:LacI family transcriptional regulator [Amylibacter sp.]|tara:strand:+ start:53 stop:1057 length:1005 start_codon:yes stop_codon:yes gene_type:complete